MAEDLQTVRDLKQRMNEQAMIFGKIADSYETLIENERVMLDEAPTKLLAIEEDLKQLGNRLSDIIADLYDKVVLQEEKLSANNIHFDPITVMDEAEDVMTKEEKQQDDGQMIEDTADPYNPVADTETESHEPTTTNDPFAPNANNDVPDDGFGDGDNFYQH